MDHHPPAAGGTTGPPPPPAAATLELWERLARDLSGSRPPAVPWRPAADALEAAAAHYRTGAAARRFAASGAAPGKIVAAFLQQDAARLGPRERACVRAALLAAVRVVQVALLELMTPTTTEQLQQQQQPTAKECGRLIASVLAPILDRNQLYYKGRRSAWRGGLAGQQAQQPAGQPQVRLQAIASFREMGGWVLLRQFFDEHQLAPEDVSVELAQNLAPLWEALDDDGGGTKEAFAWSVIHRCLLEPPVDYWKVDSWKGDALKGLNRTVTAFRLFFDALASTERWESTARFYSVWRSLCFEKWIPSQKPPLMVFGWEQVGELLQGVRAHRPPPQQIIVRDAGVPVVCGLYRFAGTATAQGYADRGKEIKFVREIPAGEEGAGKKLTIFRCTLRSLQKWWFLSEADAENPGTDRDTDYYKRKSDDENSACPPPCGWITCPNAAGMDPPPKLRAEGLVVPKGQEKNTLEDQLAAWVYEKNIVELVLGARTTRPVEIELSKALLQFVIRRDCFQKSHLDLAWETIVAKAGTEWSRELCRLIAALLPLCSAELSDFFVQKVRLTLQQSIQDGSIESNALRAVAEFCSAVAPQVDPDNVLEGKAPKLPEPVRKEITELIGNVASLPESKGLLSWSVQRKFGPEEAFSGFYDSEDEDRLVDHPTSDVIRYAGLLNLGCTGYMDVVLQQLFVSESIRNLVVSMSLPEEASTENQKYLRLLRELQSIFLHLNAALQTPTSQEADVLSSPTLRQGFPTVRSFLGTFDPSNFIEACSECIQLSFGVYEPNDAAEFADKLFEALLLGLRNLVPSAATFFEGLTMVTSVKQKICKWCDLATNRDERIQLIDCQVRDSSSLIESLQQMTTEEVMVNANRVFCSDCQTGTDTILKSGFRGLPKMLIFSLKRFDLDRNTFATIKLDSQFEFGGTLDMGSFCVDNQDASKFRLVGVVVHEGTVSGGVYYSLVRERSGRWLKFAGEEVEVFNPAMIDPFCFGGRSAPTPGAPSTNATMLFYERL